MCEAKHRQVNVAPHDEYFLRHVATHRVRKLARRPIAGWRPAWPAKGWQCVKTSSVCASSLLAAVGEEGVECRLGSGTRHS